MKKIYRTIFILILVSLITQTSFSQGPSDPEHWPTFSMTAKNFATAPEPNGQDSILFWDVYILQTNYGQPGVDPFEFCCAQYNW